MKPYADQRAIDSPKKRTNEFFIRSFVFWENLWRANLLTVLSDLQVVWQGYISICFLNFKKVSYLSLFLSIWKFLIFGAKNTKEVLKSEESVSYLNLVAANCVKKTLQALSLHSIQNVLLRCLSVQQSDASTTKTRKV